MRMIDYPVIKMTDYENDWLPCDKDDWLWEWLTTLCQKWLTMRMIDYPVSKMTDYEKWHFKVYIHWQEIMTTFESWLWI